MIKENNNYKKSALLVPVSCVKDVNGEKLGCFYNNILTSGDLECALFKPYRGKATIGCGNKKN